MQDKPAAKWLDKHVISDPEHIDGLEMSASVHEFKNKLPRHEAESKAYDEYIRERTKEACAHHLSGMKAAQGAGDTEAAQKHSTLYQLALKQLGHPEIGPVPDEILSHVKHQPSKLYNFKGHDSDMFLAGTGKEEPKEEKPVAKSIAEKIVGAIKKVI